MSKSKSFVVTLDGARPFSEVVGDLRRAGLAVQQELDEMGMVVGAAAPDHLHKLRAIKGVADVSAEVPANVGPPNSTDTW